VRRDERVGQAVIRRGQERRLAELAVFTDELLELRIVGVEVDRTARAAAARARLSARGVATAAWRAPRRRKAAGAGRAARAHDATSAVRPVAPGTHDATRARQPST